MIWTNVPPTRQGWYWLRHMCLDDELIEVVHVKHKSCGVPYQIKHNSASWSEYIDTPDFPGAYWFGPLEQPAFKESV